MSKEVVSYMLSGMDNMKSLQVQLILQCAPFLKGIKIACILNITEENSRELYEILEGTGIKFKILTRNHGKCLVFLYRRDVRLPFGMTGLQPAGLPHSDIPGSRAICASPGLFAAYHVLRRLREPRHPPSALAYFLPPRT